MSPLWDAGALVAATGGSLTAPFAATGVSIDTRTLRPGELFVALAGEHRDGHFFLAEAAALGAAGAMVHRATTSALPQLFVPDTLAGLHSLGAFARARFTGQLVAVTGSVGKTTTKEMLRTILAARGTTHAAEASHNNHWGVPLTLARMPPASRWGVVEIGMNHSGEIGPLARLARPHVALITAIGSAHVGHLGSIEAIADEKGAITEGLEPGGVAILPADAPLLLRLRRAASTARVITFGASASADARLIACAEAAEETVTTARVQHRTLCFRLPVPGRHMAMNAVAALAAAAVLGEDPEAGAAALAGFAPLAGRGARRALALAGGSALLLDESYNASAASVRAALAVLRLQRAERRIAVFGDMLELGDAGPAEHRSLAPDLAGSADLLFACGPLMRHLFEAIPEQQRGVHAADAAALAPIVAESVAAGDAVLVKGSLGSRMQTIVAALDARAQRR